MIRKEKGYKQAALLEEVARNLHKVPFPLQRKLPVLGWLLCVGNTILLFYLTIYPGWKVADQSGNAPNTKGIRIKSFILSFIADVLIKNFFLYFFLIFDSKKG